jgi:hypothetical protein
MRSEDPRILLHEVRGKATPGFDVGTEGLHVARDVTRLVDYWRSGIERPCPAAAMTWVRPAVELAVDHRIDEHPRRHIVSSLHLTRMEFGILNSLYIPRHAHRAGRSNGGVEAPGG